MSRAREFIFALKGFWIWGRRGFRARWKYEERKRTRELDFMMQGEAWISEHIPDTGDE